MYIRNPQLITGLAGLAGLTVITLALSACTSAEPADRLDITVSATDTTCDTSTAEVPAGTINFNVQNNGSKVTEFYLLDDSKKNIVSELENIAAGTSRTLTLSIEPGEYFTACKPGMTGDGIDVQPFTVTQASPQSGAGFNDHSATPEARAAVASYQQTVRADTDLLISRVAEFTAAYTQGDAALAKRLYPTTREPYERIEPLAERFADLDLRIDARETDAAAEGVAFTGFHRIEQDLWAPGDGGLSATERETLASQLNADVAELRDRLNAPDFTVTLSEVSNGAIALLDEIAAPGGKLSGEEERYSHTDLHDFAANVEGAQTAYTAVRSLAAAGDADLVATLDTRFDEMLSLLEQYRAEDGAFVTYETVDTAARKTLSETLNALSEPLASLTHTVLGASGA